MRSISNHIVPGKGAGQDTTRVTVLDEPGQGGACHHYQISDGCDNAPDVPTGGKVLCDVQFQNGPIQEAGINGVQQEHLLAIVQDRLASFQAGPFANAYNAEALEHVTAALAALHRRTTNRIARGVEGFNRA